MTREVHDVLSEHRYVLTDGSCELGHVLYTVLDPGPPELRNLRHTVVEPEHRGDGLGGVLAAGVIDLVRDAGIRVVLTCEYLQHWLSKHPEAHDVVVER
ncbi:MAG: N-acetyltransferase [Actinobacteria bacterium]|nr:N-acetyltransferase [Actinomycetota bacterium]